MIKNEQLARLLIEEEKKASTAVSSLSSALRLVSGKSAAAISVALREEEGYQKALYAAIEAICPHASTSEGPHDTSFCDLCYHSQ